MEELQKELLEKTEKKIKELIKDDIKRENIDYIYKLEDIHKDIMNEKYWKKKEEKYDAEIQRI